MNHGHWLVCVFACVIALSAGAIPIPTDKVHAISLDGTWRFKLEQSKDQRGKGEGWQNVVPVDYPKEIEPFYKTDYSEDAKWSDIKVPGNWEMAGFSPATYNEADNSSGFYRLQFDVPKAWEGQLVKLNFDGVQNGCEVWLNGQPVDVDEASWGRKNYHEGGWVAFQADLTPVVKFGEKNLLALRVTKNTKSSQLDTGDYFFLGGVHRPVTLFAVPKNHLEDLTIQTRLLDGDRAEVKAITKTTGGAKVRIKIDGVDNASETTIVEKPKLWSAEFPNLYTMHVEVLDGDKVAETVTKRFGIREVTLKDGVFLLNGKPIKMAGICRHDVSANDGTAVGPELWRKDIELMKACNINAIRTSHYPYGSGFYDLCDELGMYVADELPYCWTPTDDKEMEPAFTQRARETIRRDKNHPCVLLWTVGNENKEGRNLQVVADLVKELDPTRPRDVSCMGAAKYKTEMSDSHYWTPEKMIEGAKRDREVKKPHIYLETPNNWDVSNGADAGCWEVWTPVLQKTWDVAMQYEVIPGIFLWEWQDRAVADKNPTKLYKYDERSGINYFKIKGIVDAYRNPRPWYYTLKNVFSPIQFGDKANASGDNLSFEVENRYSFTDLSSLKAHWSLIKPDGSKVDGGGFDAHVAPLSKATVSIALGNNADAAAVQIDFDDASGRNVISHQYDLKKSEPKSELSASMPEGFKFPQLNFILREDKKVANWRKMERIPATVINAKQDEKSLEGDLALERDPSKVVGHVKATLDGNDFKYRIEWTGTPMDVLEVGWAIPMGEKFDRFSWNRKANWTVYPDTHIARPIGTAKPDSADVSYLKMDRPDAFDFNSTKYNCNFATLTDESGKGVRVEFNENDRHHCRGGITDKGYVLFVNKRVCPPQDLSTNVVPELYLKLKSGDVVEGSFKIGATK
jgi:beta-galactosidase/beta-glucuronidase